MPDVLVVPVITAILVVFSILLYNALPLVDECKKKQEPLEEPVKFEPVVEEPKISAAKTVEKKFVKKAARKKRRK
jgi:hypothetical protein